MSQENRIDQLNQEHREHIINVTKSLTEAIYNKNLAINDIDDRVRIVTDMLDTMQPTMFDWLRRKDQMEWKLRSLFWTVDNVCYMYNNQKQPIPDWFSAKYGTYFTKQ